MDVKKLGRVPDDGGWRFVGRRQGGRNRAKTAARTGAPKSKYSQPLIGTCYLLRSSTTTPASPTSRPATMRPRNRCRGAAQRGGLVHRTRHQRPARPHRQRRLLPIVALARHLHRARRDTQTGATGRSSRTPRRRRYRRRRPAAGVTRPAWIVLAPDGLGVTLPLQRRWTSRLRWIALPSLMRKFG